MKNCRFGFISFYAAKTRDLVGTQQTMHGWITRALLCSIEKGVIHTGPVPLKVVILLPIK